VDDGVQTAPRGRAVVGEVEDGWVVDVDVGMEDVDEAAGDERGPEQKPDMQVLKAH
jgi:hypothetical protein